MFYIILVQLQKYIQFINSQLRYKCKFIIIISSKTFSFFQIDIKDTDPADTNQCIIDSLKKIQYHPNTVQNDPGAFRRNLLQGDKKTIYPILRYIFENADTIRNLTYLAQ